MPNSQIPSMFQVAEIELTYRSKVPVKDRIQVASSNTAYKVLMASWDENRIELIEQFKILLLDHGNHCLGVSEISMGGMAMCPVDRRIIFGTALKAKAAKLILAHNHPSGNSKPSCQDEAVTDMLINAGKIIDIEIVDHLILTQHGYHSMAHDGYFL